MSIGQIIEQREDLRYAGQVLLDALVSKDPEVLEAAFEHACVYFGKTHTVKQCLESMRSMIQKL